jgi:peroxiredoxin
MTNLRCALLIALVLLASPAVWGQASESSINKQLQSLRIVAGPMMPGAPGGAQKQGVPEDQRPAMIVQVAKDINTLPAGASRVKLATSLVQIASAGETGHDALQAAADSLAQALAQTPQPLGKDGQPAMQYMQLARLARLAQITTTLQDPMLTKAADVLAANDADVAKADFTLKDLNGKKYTLSGLRGKIVLINFWAAQCLACAKEMQDLDLIYTHYQQQGLVILSITGDNPFATNKYLSSKNYHPTVLFDDGGKVGKDFHVDELHPEGLPRTFVFDREGKLVGESLDACTQRQFFIMLGKAGLQPEK